MVYIVGLYWFPLSPTPIDLMYQQDFNNLGSGTLSLCDVTLGGSNSAFLWWFVTRKWSVKNLPNSGNIIYGRPQVTAQTRIIPSYLIWNSDFVKKSIQNVLNFLSQDQVAIRKINTSEDSTTYFIYLQIKFIWIKLLLQLKTQNTCWKLCWGNMTSG